MNPPKAVRKYLDAWAEPEVAIAAAVRESYAHVLVVPARHETGAFVRDLAAAPGLFGDRGLVIVVVNGTDDDALEHRDMNELLWREIARDSRPLCAAPRAVVRAFGAFDLLAIDRFRSPWCFGARDGVGTARKIGCDVALALVAAGKVASSWIHTSDADAVQPVDRMRVAESVSDDGVVALTFPYEHVVEDPSLGDAMLAYEISLAYWVLGLEWARSPYAFSSVGSTIAVRADAYARVRGFPRVAAGEDFHFLDKLAKIGAVRMPEGGRIRLAGRVSHRVPFGTGAALRRMNRGEELELYDPIVFAHLREWLAAMSSWAGGSPVDASGLGDAAREAARGLGAFDALEGVRSRIGGASAHRAFHEWFDALKTLRFVHAVRDRGAPSVPLREALRHAPFVDAPEGAPLRELRDRLAGRRVLDAGVRLTAASSIR